MGICGLGGLWRTTLASEVRNHEQASFGSSSFGNLTQYDVFLNHRGPDLKKTFVSHLHKALRLAGCDPFLDAKSLVKGQHGLNSINEVLTGVLVHVAIFSPRYAESKYCLNELCDILESQKPIIPVFYDVEPGNLRWTEVGPFAKAFHKHLNKGRDQDIVRWKAALSQAAAITGFTLAESDNDTVKLEEKVVVAVLNALPPLPLAPVRHLVGLKEPSSYLSEMFREMGDNVGIIGICGMGGIGKTTLAREVYNHEQSNFDSRCFLKDVKETKGVDFTNLQMKMVTDLLHVDAKKLHWNFVRWFDQIQKRKVFIVIDDVNERKQVDELIPNFKDLASGSRILITSRENDVLKSIMVDMPNSEIYLVRELNLSNSLNLFVRCAFQKNNINDVDATFHDIAREIASACCGLPLALEVMGSYLADKKNLPCDAKYWKDAIHALRSNGDIMTSLQISYDGLLNNEDKQLFLDIACFMLGQPKKVAMEIWESGGNHRPPSWSLSKLIDKCLVKIDGDGRLRMHALLRDMGRNIVMQRARYKPEMQSHIWDASVAIKILQKNKGLNEVIALSVVRACTGIACKAEEYAKLKELKYLLLDGCHVNGNFSEWSKELRWLQWRSLPHQELPLSLNLPNLVVLDLGESNHLTRVWSRDFKLEFSCVELRMLILNNCKNLEELPEDMNKLSKLKCVNLEGCSNLHSLPDSIGTIKELEYLNLSGCDHLSSLPKTIANLLKLKEIIIDKCILLRKLPKKFGKLSSLIICKASMLYALEKLPDDFGELESLIEADFDGCKNLQSLGENFGNLRSLRELNLNGCKRLANLPESFSNLSNLEKLNLNGSEQIVKLPSSICGLKNLKVLSMRESTLQELPRDFGDLKSLIHANFWGCMKLQNLCENFGSLGSLRKLNLKGCKRLCNLPKSFSKLSSLEQLNLGQCGKHLKLPSMKGLKKLRVLSMHESGLEELPEDFGDLESLAHAYFEYCKELQSLSESFGNLGSLRELKLSGCKKLVNLPKSFSKLSNLEKLNLSRCEQLLKLPSMNGLKKLRVLNMQQSILEELPEDFGHLESLTHAYFEDCKELQSLCKNFSSLRNLQELKLSGCKRLVKLPKSFSRLSNLEDLNLNQCEQLLKLPPMNGLKKLRVLNMHESGLEELPEDFGDLESLTYAHFKDCKHLRSLCENFGNLRSLRDLKLSGCKRLTNLPKSFSKLSNLDKLNLSRCKQLIKFPSSVCGLKNLKVLRMQELTLEELPRDFGDLKNLIHVTFWGCLKLQSLCENFGSLRSLRKLNLKGCKRLCNLPKSFSKLSSLEQLNLSRCKQLLILPSMKGLKKLRVLSMHESGLEELPEDFGDLENLTHVYFEDCKELQSLGENFGNLRSLQELNLSGCKRLINLPESFSKLSNLEKLNLDGCEKILKLPLSILKNLKVLSIEELTLKEPPKTLVTR